MNIIKRYQDVVLVMIALLFVGIIASFYMWSIGSMLTDFGRANQVEQAPASTSDFNLEGAKQLLTERGLL